MLLSRRRASCERPRRASHSVQLPCMQHLSRRLLSCFDVQLLQAVLCMRSNPTRFNRPIRFGITLACQTVLTFLFATAQLARSH